MPYKAIVSDLDGTLLNANGRLSDITKTVLTQLCDAGVEIVFATGRHPRDAKLVADSLGRNISIVGLNGALTWCGESQNIIDEQYISPEQIHKLLELVQGHDVHLSFFDREGWKLLEENQMAKQYASFSGFPYKVITAEEISQLKINKLLLWKNQGIQSVEETIKQHLSGQLECYRTSEHQLEIGPANVSKASAATKLLAQKGISFQNQAMAFGDSLNDLPLLSQAAQGVIMRNAMPDLANQLSMLPIADCHSTDGVARFLQLKFDV
ncbi:Cof-type HAD-IIB family hydrolase [Vibrio sagamiensis]|uniref:Haloacid dehalogenase n=1 Tax=Vibrio sagamiensis NBRC 104589 TaxID=1219064 RepID=A0A511QFH1_9VIBR|nr:Cof-type HAD-IIB family hydrolase [Vibrio sagamiensis]PNQ59502.1 Cof-type HAD-IIB family hydrolase [Vibrio agarivorans]GEM75212.1 haloacid dehalogenase [Vibrio sagamiensis NBRC 104589]